MEKYTKNVIAVKHNDLEKLIIRAWKTKTPLFITGPIGIGKSTVIRTAGHKIAKELGLEVVETKEPNLHPDKFVITDVRLAQRDPADVIGVPYIFAVVELPDKGSKIIPVNALPNFISQNGNSAKIRTYVTKWSAPSWLPRDPDSAGILFVDEFNLAPPIVQSAFYEAINDRRLGDWICPDKWIVIGAGNRGAEDGVSIFDPPDPLANRFCWVELLVPSIEEWTTWALNHGVDHRIVSFLNTRRALLYDHDPRRKEKAFPTPRGWGERASPLIKGIEDLDEIELYVSSAVGSGAAIEFVEWLRTRKELPPPEQYISKAKKIKIPSDTSLLYVLCSNLADYYLGSKNKYEVLRGIVIIANRIDKELGLAEISMYLLKMVKSLNQEMFISLISEMEEFQKLALKIKSYLSSED